MFSYKKFVSNYIKKLILQGEHQQLDFKFEISDAKKIARTLAAFANTDGGRLLVGVKDNGVIAGIHSDEEIYMVESAAKIYCLPEVIFSVVNHLVEGKTVLEIMVKPSESKPVMAPDNDGRWAPFLRVDDENRLANNVILKVWNLKKQEVGVFIEITDAQKQLLNHLELVGKVSFLDASRYSGLSKHKTENLLAQLIVLRIIEPIVEHNRFYYQIKSKGNFTY